MRAGLLVALALAGCAGDQERMAKAEQRGASELASRLEGRVAGKPERCVDVQRLQGPQPYGGRTLIYNDGSRLWRNDVIGQCPGLWGDPVIIAEVYGSQLCRNDRFRTVQRGGGNIPSAYCRYGDFVPYTKP